MALRNISASVFRAAICSPLERESGEVGDGLDSPWMSLVVATAMASAEDRFGISLSCRKILLYRRCAQRVFWECSSGSIGSSWERGIYTSHQLHGGAKVSLLFGVS